MKDLAIVRYPRRGSAKAIKSALNLYFHSRARAARILALSIVICLIPPFGSASEALEQKFDGVVERWLRESGQSVEWIFCLTAARVLVANQEQR